MNPNISRQMRRIFPRNLQDKFQLSFILERYLSALEEPPWQLRLAMLAYETRIPETIFLRLVNLQRNPADAINIEADDFHILFSNITSRYPTVKIWQADDGEIFIEL